MVSNPLWRMAAVALLCMTSQVWGAQKQEKSAQEQGVVSFSEQYRSMERSDDPQEHMVISDEVMHPLGNSELRVGDEPTREQIEAADTDMVWIKEEEVAGFKLYMPVVYLKEEDEQEE